jgi:hypothetical protein
VASAEIAEGRGPGEQLLPRRLHLRRGEPLGTGRHENSSFLEKLTGRRHSESRRLPDRANHWDGFIRGIDLPTREGIEPAEDEARTPLQPEQLALPFWGFAEEENDG